MLLTGLLNFLSNSHPAVTSSKVGNNSCCRLVVEQKLAITRLSNELFLLCFQFSFAVCYFEFLGNIFNLSRRNYSIGLPNKN
jgi:hypothetical protein